MDVADLPAVIDDTSRLKLAEAIAAGYRGPEIAKKLAPNDLKRQKALRKRIRRMVGHDDRLAQLVAEQARIEFVYGLGPTARALVKQAKRRPDAAKLLFEASGFHNPRVKHEHSGEIKIKLDMPRPKFVDAEVTDADVVEPS